MKTNRLSASAGASDLPRPECYYVGVWRGRCLKKGEIAPSFSHHLSPALSVFISPAFPDSPSANPSGFAGPRRPRLFMDSTKHKGSTAGSKSEGRHEGGTRDPRRDQVRIPKEIVLIPELAVAEFVADHERVPEKNRGLESVLEGAQRGTFRMGLSGEAPEVVVGASLRTADLYRVNLEVQYLKTFGSVAFPIPKNRPKQAGFVDELLTRTMRTSSSAELYANWRAKVPITLEIRKTRKVRRKR